MKQAKGAAQEAAPKAFYSIRVRLSAPLYQAFKDYAESQHRSPPGQLLHMMEECTRAYREEGRAR
jgi:hypothetical protein